MLTTTLAPAILATLLSSSTPPAPTLHPQPGAAGDPPSTVLLKSKSVTIGQDAKDIEDMLAENEPFRINVRAFDAETPDFSERVDDFYLMVSEVTNEQYAAFVRATGHRPPFSWGEDAINAWVQQALKENGEARQKARAEGKPDPGGIKIDGPMKEKWWEENWRGADWAIPKGMELAPVTFVAHDDAKAYAAWVGMRLPTEFEYQRAARAKGKALFPWGDEWEDGKFAATAEIRRLKEAPLVGSFPDGANEEGVHDLAGNVWEWTDSPYVAYERFKPNKYEFGKGSGKVTLEPVPEWDPNKRVVVGGCFLASKTVARATTRRPTDRTQMTNAMGFRCAASARPGLDIAEAIYQEEVRNSEARITGVSYSPQDTAIVDSWSASPSTATELPKGYQVPSGYQVIDGYDYVLFTPATELEASSNTQLDSTSRVEPVHIGYLATSLDLVEPALPAGTYLVAYRGKGKPKADDKGEGEGEGKEGGEEEAGDEETIDDPRLAGVDLKKDNYIFYDARTGEVAATAEVGSFKIDKLREASTLSWDVKKVWVGQGDDKHQEEQHWLALNGAVLGKIKNRGLKFELRLLPNERAGKISWR